MGCMYIILTLSRRQNHIHNQKATYQHNEDVKNNRNAYHMFKSTSRRYIRHSRSPPPPPPKINNNNNNNNKKMLVFFFLKNKQTKNLQIRIKLNVLVITGWEITLCYTPPPSPAGNYVSNLNIMKLFRIVIIKGN